MPIADANKNRECQREWARRKYADTVARAERKVRVDAWRKENPDRVQAQAKKSRAKARQAGKNKIGTIRRRQKVRAWLQEYKSTHPCSCGESDPALLEFHHIDPSQKRFSIGAGRGYSLKTVKVEVEKCVVLCADCHTGAHKKVASSNQNMVVVV